MDWRVFFRKCNNYVEFDFPGTPLNYYQYACYSAGQGLKAYIYFFLLKGNRIPTHSTFMSQFMQLPWLPFYNNDILF